MPRMTMTHAGIEAPTQLLINGEFRDASGGGTFTTFDLAHGADPVAIARVSTIGCVMLASTT